MYCSNISNLNILAATIANIIANNLNSNDLQIYANLLMAIGQNLCLIDAQNIANSLCEKKEE